MGGGEKESCMAMITLNVFNPSYDWGQTSVSAIYRLFPQTKALFG